jgi:hypothetical protein
MVTYGDLEKPGTHTLQQETAIFDPLVLERKIGANVRGFEAGAQRPRVGVTGPVMGKCMDLFDEHSHAGTMPARSVIASLQIRGASPTLLRHPPTNPEIFPEITEALQTVGYLHGI